MTLAAPVGESPNPESPELSESFAPEELDIPEEPKGLDQVMFNRIHMAINHWHSHGYPEKAKVLNECLAQNRTPPANLIYFGDLRPETSVDPEKLEIPPRYGSLASQLKWAAFAKQTTDMEPSILEKMGQRDIISMLEVKGVIPKEAMPPKLPVKKPKPPPGKPGRKTSGPKPK